jgi:hypothetical protein
VVADMAGLLEHLGVRSTEPRTFCRDEAERLRILAEYFTDAELQNELMAMAERFDRIAARRRGL